jgi:uncharacterized protein (TIGR00369 family)
MSVATPEPVLTDRQLVDFFCKAFPSSPRESHLFEIIEPGFVRIRQTVHDSMLRPGGIVSGPTQMGLADRVAYAVILAHIGIVPMAVTSNLNISFVRAVEARDLYADARIIKLGRRLATVDVRLWQDDPDKVAAQATVTYSLPAQ